MSHEIHEIKTTTVDHHSVTVQLENGVTVLDTSNKGYIHVHLSGIGCASINVQQLAANNVDIKYEVPK